DCIGVQLVNKAGAVPAHIVITKEGSVTNVCEQVVASEPLKAYFSSKVTGVNNADTNKGYIAIGSSTSVY
ncbi:MAG: hypothetical protein SPG65_04435, partial [Campylobacter sp.]|nr:hypothetical protein [Campylobacter sp.]